MDYSNKNSGSALVSVLTISAAIGIASLSLVTISKRQADKNRASMEASSESLLIKQLSDAISSPYAAYFIRMKNPSFYKCLKDSRACKAVSKTPVAFQLQERTITLSGGNTFYGHDLKICSDAGREARKNKDYVCDKKYKVNTYFYASCPAGSASLVSCPEDPSIILGFDLSKKVSVNGKPTYIESKAIGLSRKIANKNVADNGGAAQADKLALNEKAVAVFMCPPNEVLIGINEDGSIICNHVTGANIVAADPVTAVNGLLTPPSATPPPSTPPVASLGLSALTTGFINTHAPKLVPTQVSPVLADKFKNCSASTGQIPALSFGNDAGTKIRLEMHAGKNIDPSGLGNWTAPETKTNGCFNTAIGLGFTCRSGYQILSSGGIVCLDLLDGGKGGAPLIEFSEFNGECRGKFVGCRGTFGCFAKGTRVSLFNGSTKAIENIGPTDRLYNPFYEEGVLAKRLIVGPEKDDLIKFGLSDGSQITLTKYHPVETSSGYTFAIDLIVGDEMIGQGRKSTKVTTLELVAGNNQNVYNIELAGELPEDHRLIFANGVSSGDFSIQQKMQKEAGH